MNRTRLAGALTAGLTAAATAAAMLAAPATAAPTVSDPITTGLVGPLQLEVDGNRIFVAQSFAGLLTRVRPDGTKRVLHAEPGGEVAGMAVRGQRIAFVTTVFDEQNPESWVKVLRPDGTVRKVANLQEFEAEENPDADFAYGFRNLDPECAAQLPEDAPFPEPYSGIVESHPYAMTNAPGGGWYVADAAGNTILKVMRNGDVEVVHVVRPQRTVITEQMATDNGLPACAVGEVVAFEGVPTDVELDRRGNLVVSLLPGGPEDPSLGARGSVIRVDPRSGRATQLAGGFLGATNVAVGPSGRIFVAELFAGKISSINRQGVVKPVVEVPPPAGLEWANGRLYATIDVFNEPAGGSLVTITP